MNEKWLKTEKNNGTFQLLLKNLFPEYGLREINQPFLKFDDAEIEKFKFHSSKGKSLWAM